MDKIDGYFLHELQPIGYHPFSKILEMKLKLYTGLWFFSSFWGRDVFSSSDLTWAYLTFWGNVLVSIDMFIILVMGIIIISRQFFRTLVVTGSRSDDFDDEPKISFIISSSVACSIFFILYPNNIFCTYGIFFIFLKIWNNSFNLINKIFWGMVKRDFTYANTGRDSGGILCRILFMEFHKQRGFSEICRFSFCHHYITQVAVPFVTRTIKMCAFENMAKV